MSRISDSTSAAFSERNTEDDDESHYRSSIELALRGNRHTARSDLLRLLQRVSKAELKAKINNDLGTIAAIEGHQAEARDYFRMALELAPNWSVPVENEYLLNQRAVGAPSQNSTDPVERPIRIAVISLLFNWPSTGGGTIHTAEIGKFLTEAGYETLHIYAIFPEWGLGNVTQPTLSRSHGIAFSTSEWTIQNVQARFRDALKDFDPDHVIVTDSWNSKPILAKAAEGYKFYLRIAAQEGLCPLNNVRLLFDGKFFSCPKHQLATPDSCRACVGQNGRFSGGLHQAERDWVEYGSNDYDQLLRWSFSNAEAVLVVNPLIGAMVSPYAKKVCVIPSGFDAGRFPASFLPPEPRAVKRVLFAGLVDEPMKGFEVAVKACALLWQERQDFELVATADPPGRLNPFTRYIGWQTQENLPQAIFDSDILVVPTVAEEALGRTAVEAMAAGRPVVASRIGGLQFSVADGATGLLFHAGDPVDLAQKLKSLFDDEDLRIRLGRAARRRFEAHYSWDAVIRQHYTALFGATKRQSNSTKRQNAHGVLTV